MSTTPNVFFIDDSATMREVIKIAFRRESMNVVACHDAESAINLMEQNAPDVVISDVIMPGKDGYEVCQHIKKHPRLGKTPVILMSGVVNKSVAERAFAVKADELIRKPFQPQDLITRVRHLLRGGASVPAPPPQNQAASVAALSSIFAGGTPKSASPMPPKTPLPSPRSAELAATVAAAMSPVTPAPPVSIPGAQITGAVALPGATPAPTSVPQAKVPAPPPSSANMDVTKLRIEILRLQSQVKKLQSEIDAEREYSKALEEHIKTLQDSD